MLTKDQASVESRGHTQGERERDTHRDHICPLVHWPGLGQDLKQEGSSRSPPWVRVQAFDLSSIVFPGALIELDQKWNILDLN